MMRLGLLRETTANDNTELHVIRPDACLAFRNRFAHNPSIGGHPAFCVPAPHPGPPCESLAQNQPPDIPGDSTPPMFLRVRSALVSLALEKKRVLIGRPTLPQALLALLRKPLG